MVRHRPFHFILPEGRRFAFDEITAATAKMRHRQITQHARHHQGAQEGVRKLHGGLIAIRAGIKPPGGARERQRTDVAAKQIAVIDSQNIAVTQSIGLDFSPNGQAWLGIAAP